MLRLDKDRKIRYNYPQLAGTYKALVGLQEQQIQEAKEIDLDYEDYKRRETQLKAIYVLGDITKEFISEFHRGIMQGYNGAIVLVARLQQEYIIRNVWNLVREVIREYPNYLRNKSNRHKLYRELQPVQILSRLQEVILQDFIIKLLKLKDFSYRISI